MPINIFDLYAMLAVLEQRHVPNQFLLNMFFSESETHDTKQVSIDIEKGGKTLAPFVAPVHEGKVMVRDGYTTEVFTPPYIKPKMSTTAGDLLKRMPGEVVFSGTLSPEQRAAQRLAKDLIFLDDTITRTEEWMAAKGLFTGVVPVRGEGVSVNIDFGYEGGEHTLTLATTDKWDVVDETATGDPIFDLEEWADDVMHRSGITPNTAVFGRGAYKAFINHPKTKEFLNNRRIELGNIDPEQVPDGAKRLGYLPEAGLTLYTYSEQYLDPDTESMASMVPDGAVLIGSTRAKCIRHYAVIQDVSAITEGLYAVPRYPKTWITNDPSARWLLVQSAPLPTIHQPDAFQVVTVI